MNVQAIDPKQHAKAMKDRYENRLLSDVNDHAVRLSVMTEPYFWHQHPNSDETFLVVEGTLIVDLDSHSLQLTAGQMCTIPRGVPHQTRPQGARSVNLTIELATIETIELREERGDT